MDDASREAIFCPFFPPVLNPCHVVSFTPASLASVQRLALVWAHLVVLTALVLGDLVDVVRHLLEVFLVLGEAGLELEELLLLALLDGKVLAGALAPLEGVSLTTGLGRSSGVTLGHHASAGHEGRTGRQEARTSKLGDGCAQHFVIIDSEETCWMGKFEEDEGVVLISRGATKALKTLSIGESGCS